MRPRPEPGGYYKREYWGITIYGQYLTMEEIEAEERSLGASGEELEFTLRGIRQQESRGFIWTKAYSVACPQGEYGFTAYRTMEAITKEEFENARAVEWRD